MVIIAKIKLAIILIIILTSSNVFAQIYQRQIFSGLHGNATKLIGGEEDDSTVRVLGEFNLKNSSMLCIGVNRKV